jgi:hypothetical protein
MSLFRKAADRLFIGKFAHGRKKLACRSHRASNNPLMTRRVRKSTHSFARKFCGCYVDLVNPILTFMQLEPRRIRTKAVRQNKVRTCFQEFTVQPKHFLRTLDAPQFGRVPSL